VILPKNLIWQKGSTTTCWRSSGISQFSSPWFLISAYINGEVVVIDGEWLKGAGQFNMLRRFQRNFDQLEMMIKAKKNK
jgi:hypothetical protein